jgi:hypothetical protein
VSAQWRRAAAIRAAASVSPTSLGTVQGFAGGGVGGVGVVVVVVVELLVVVVVVVVVGGGAGGGAVVVVPGVGATTSTLQTVDAVPKKREFRISPIAAVIAAVALAEKVAVAPAGKLAI